MTMVKPRNFLTSYGEASENLVTKMGRLFGPVGDDEVTRLWRSADDNNGVISKKRENKGAHKGSLPSHLGSLDSISDLSPILQRKFTRV